MTIQLNQVTKQYGAQKAVDQLNLEVNQGEILGLLGPNGAGKTTTMRMIAGSLKGYEGEILLDGTNIQDLGVGLQQKVGYLPEFNPLYTDMYVTEFLVWLGKLLGINAPKKRCLEVIEMVGLEDEKHKKINQLSKGYRQRVGLAQVLLNDPEVLILDEPISGLDPNQIEEIRNLIRAISKEKTIIFSSHILQEIEAICSRVVILDHGRKVMDKKIDEAVMQNDYQHVILVELEVGKPIQFGKLSGLKNQKAVGNNTYELDFSRPDDPRRDVFDIVVESGDRILSMYRKQSNIQSVFSDLTKSKS